MAFRRNLLTTELVRFKLESTYQANFLFRVPHYQKGFSISFAKALDKAALELLDYNIFPFQWSAWLHNLDEPPSANMRRPEFTNYCSYWRSFSASATSVWKDLILLDNFAIPVLFLAPWNLAEDVIIHATGRRQPFPPLVVAAAPAILLSLTCLLSSLT